MLFVVAPAGTAVRIDVAEVIVNGAVTAPNFTATKLAKYEVPGTVMVTVLPTLPSDGEMDAIVGAAAVPAVFAKVEPEVTEPPAAAT